MARITNTPREIARLSLAYIQNKINEVNSNLKDTEELIGRIQTEPTTAFTTSRINAFKTQLMNQAKTANSEAISMYRWLLSEFNITIPAALTDTAVDAIDEDIRTHEEEQ